MATSWDVAAENGRMSLEPSQAEAAAGLKERRPRAPKVTTTRKTNAIQQSFQSSEFAEMMQHVLQLQFAEHETRMESLVAHKLALLQQHMSMSLQHLESVLVSRSSTVSMSNRTEKKVSIDAQAPVHQLEVESRESAQILRAPRMSRSGTCVSRLMTDESTNDFTLRSTSQPGDWLSAEEYNLAATNERVKKTQLAPKQIVSPNKRMSRFVTRAGSSSWKKSVKRLAQRVSQHNMFDSFISTVIVLNAMYIGYCTDWRISNPPEAKMNIEWRVIDLVFTGIFSVELAIRIVAEGWLFLSGDNWRWNLLDSVIVALAIAEELINFIDAGGVTTIRLLRMLRLTRIVRAVRLMRFFRDLRMMVFGIISSLKALIWCIILLVFMQLIFSVIVIELVADDMHRIKQQTGCSNAGCPDDEEPPPLLMHWGSMLSALYTLFQAITGGQDWYSFAEPLAETHQALTLFFCTYISFAVFAVLNIVTSVFVENAASFARLDANDVILDDITDRKRLIEEVKTVFKAADKDQSGSLDYLEFKKLFNDPVVQAYFRKLRLDVTQSGAQGLFRLMDFEGTGKIDIDTFVMSVSQLRGEAKSLEIAKLRYDLCKISLRLRHITRILETEFAIPKSAVSMLSNPANDRASFESANQVKFEEEVLTVESFKPGDRIEHSKRGPGTVDRTDAKAIYVDFDNGEHHHYENHSLATGKVEKLPDAIIVNASVQ